MLWRHARIRYRIPGDQIIAPFRSVSDADDSGWLGERATEISGRALGFREQVSIRNGGIQAERVFDEVDEPVMVEVEMIRSVTSVRGESEMELPKTATVSTKPEPSPAVRPRARIIPPVGRFRPESRQFAVSPTRVALPSGV